MSQDFLAAILERKRSENTRRRAHGAVLTGLPDVAEVARESRGDWAISRLRRHGALLPRVIAEIKLRSPSAGQIRAREPGELVHIARGYASAGAAAISVLCDGPGFGGSPLDLRRVSRAVDTPLLFKEFVLDPLQVRLARAVGAHMVLLLVRALPLEPLRELIAEITEQGMAPVVEVADDAELDIALQTDATILGVNARDLRTFKVDPERAKRIIARIPSERVAIHMSGITSAEDLLAVAATRADAVLVGEALMRADEPGERLAQWLQDASS